jgi:hypothetical protein
VGFPHRRGRRWPNRRLGVHRRWTALRADSERLVPLLSRSLRPPYYTTASGEVANGPAAPLAPRELTIERVVLRDGRFERLPSFDVVSAFDGVPMAWEHFAASGERVLWGSEGWLYVVDFSGSEPRVERHDLGLRGCTALDLRGNTAYCAQGTAGYREITLGTP